jgi:hypothetical protein
MVIENFLFVIWEGGFGKLCRKRAILVNSTAKKENPANQWQNDKFSTTHFQSLRTMHGVVAARPRQALAAFRSRLKKMCVYATVPFFLFAPFFPFLLALAPCASRFTRVPNSKSLAKPTESHKIMKKSSQGNSSRNGF